MDERMNGDQRASEHPLLQDLNAVQRAAVTHPGGPLLILAGAGSGKTRVLTRRVAWLVRECHVPPHRILAVTFTNKAAGEMRNRLERTLGAAAAGLWIGTFHALGLRWIRRHAAAAGYAPRVSVFDQEDQLGLIRRLLKAEGFEDTPRRGRDLHSVISRAKNRGESPAELAEHARSPADRMAARLYGAYQQALRAQNALDFDDLLLVALDLFRVHPEIAELYAEQFAHVLVDEYQDTNHVQFLLVERLARRHRNIFVVGDDDQSIYGWRGADVRNILDFQSHFPEPTVLYLEQNYRSTRPILDFANEIIRHNPDRWEKKLWTERAAGKLPEFFMAADEDEEAEEIARRIAHAHRDGERAFREMAVFYRTHAQSRPLEDAFLRRGIPYVLVGGVQFYARREVKDLLAYLRLLINPQDEAALRRSLGAPRRGIGERTIELLLAHAHGQADDPLVVAAGVESDGLRGGAARKRLREFAAAMLAWRTRVSEPPERILEEIVGQTGYERYLEAEGGDWEDRVANVRELIEGARLFSGREAEGGVAAYIDQVSLLTGLDALPEEADTVTMMTVHNAKGLEFPAVFVSGLEEGLLPHASALSDPDELAEERRLFYVACTRAQEELTLSASELRQRYGTAGGGLSRFLSHAPRALYHDATARSLAVPSGLGRGQGRGGWLGHGVGEGRAGEPAFDGTEAPAAHIGPDEHPLVGRRVYHATFGAGIVTAAEGAGERMRITVRFQAGRTRKVLKSYLEWED
jgi:DNA helicase-2/ATP-dependent DNA helicase PcrA